jgi:DNA-directed RNA polymerase III subunit RPC3
MVFHHTTGEGRTFYEPNPRNAYYLVRSGRVLVTIENRYGKIAAAIIAQLILLGHASIGQLKKSSREYYESTRTGNKNTNGDAVDSSLGPSDSSETHLDGDLDNALRDLCKHGLVCRLRQAHLRSEADNRQIAEERVHNRPIVSATKGTKFKQETTDRIEREMEKEIDTHINILKPRSSSTMPQKRKMDGLDGSTSNAKKAKMANDAAISEAEVDSTCIMDDETNDFSESLIVRLNYPRIAAFFRNSRLVKLVTDTYGKTVSATYEAILKQLEPTSPVSVEGKSLSPEQEQPSEVSSDIDEDRLALDLAFYAPPNDRQGAQWASVNGYVNGVKHRLTSETRSHLEILCERPYRFLIHSLEYPDKYAIDYSDLSVHLRNAEVFRIISSRFDKYAVRIIRVLLDKGKIDEKHLQEIVLMSAKELRQTLAMLQQAGILELQEVPREAQRQPSRTMYLWFYDPDRARKMLIEDTYKCMARCLQRLKVESEEVKPTLEKSERSDVKGQEERLLAKAELEVLKGWRRKEEWLLGEVGRLDELILVLRDI